MNTIERIEPAGETLAAVVPSSFIDRVADSLGTHARAETIFGAAVRNNGTTVIPVGKVRLGMGGGIGRSGTNDEGSGGGGGLVVSPVGYIELNPKGSTFRPIRSTPLIIATFAAGIAAGAFAAWRGLARARPEDSEGDSAL